MCTVLTEPLRDFCRVAGRIGHCSIGKLQAFGRGAPEAKNFLQSRRCEQSQEAKPRRADNKRVWAEPGHKHAFPSFYIESSFSYINVEFSFEDIEEFVLARVHVRGRFSSGRQHCLYQQESSASILCFREVGR